MVYLSRYGYGSNRETTYSISDVEKPLYEIPLGVRNTELVRYVVLDGYRVKLSEGSSSTSPYLLNVMTGEIITGSTANNNAFLNNKPAWFTIPKGAQVKFSVYDIEFEDMTTTFATSTKSPEMGVRFRRANVSGQNIDGLTVELPSLELNSMGNPVDFVSEFTAADDIEVGLLYFYVRNAYHIAIRFNISLTVNGQRYI